jgi:hypothetical protein
MRKRVCQLDDDGHLDVAASVKIAKKEISELERKLAEGQPLSRSETILLCKRSLTKALKSDKPQDESDDEAEEPSAQGGGPASKPKSKSKSSRPRSVGLISTEVSTDLVQLLITRFVRLNLGAPLLVADICCGTASVQRSMLYMLSDLAIVSGCVSIDTDSHVLHYAKQAYHKQLAQLADSVMSDSRMETLQSLSSTAKVNRDCTSVVSGTEVS